MDGSKGIKSTKDIAVMALMCVVLFTQEYLLSSLPGVQLTIFLMILFSKKFGFIKSSLIIIIHVLLDNLFMSSFSLMYTPTMLVGWLFIPVALSTVFRKINSPIMLALLGILYSFIYCWLFIIPNYLLMNINPIDYLIADIIFEIILAVCSFLSILLLYKPCSIVIDKML